MTIRPGAMLLEAIFRNGESKFYATSAVFRARARRAIGASASAAARSCAVGARQSISFNPARTFAVAVFATFATNVLRAATASGFVVCAVRRVKADMPGIYAGTPPGCNGRCNIGRNPPLPK